MRQPGRRLSLGGRPPDRGILAFAAAALLGSAGPALASGYSIYEQGVAAMANGGALTARANDPSALYFDPAGILQLEGLHVYGGATPIFLGGSSVRSSSSGRTYSQESSVSSPSFLFATQRISPRWAWGIALTMPSGVHTDWGPEFEGRFIARRSSLRMLQLNPNLAYQVTPAWSIAFGLDVSRVTVSELSRQIDLTPLGYPGVEGLSKLSGNGTGTGVNAAVRYGGGSGLCWGASYRTGMRPELAGGVEFSSIPAALGPLFPSGAARARFPVPASLATGVGYLSGEAWDGELDVVWTRWSDFDWLRVDLANTTSYSGVPVVSDVAQLEDWVDTFAFRAGLARHITRRHTVRLGLYFDRTPVSANHLRPRLPDADRMSVQAGYGYRTPSGFVLDLAFQAIFFRDRVAIGAPDDPTNPVFPGRYENFIPRIGLALGYSR